MKKIVLKVKRNTLSFGYTIDNSKTTDITVATNVINTEELIFSPKYILKNISLIRLFINDLVSQNKINEVIIGNYELFDLVLKIIKLVKEITIISFKEDISLTYYDINKIINNKNINKINCYTMPLFMIERLDKYKIVVQLRSEVFYLSDFMKLNNLNNYSDLYYKKSISFHKKMNENDIKDLKSFLDINKYLKTIYLYYFSSVDLQAILKLLEETKRKCIKVYIVESKQNLELLGITHKDVKKLAYKYKKINKTQVRIYYSSDYIKKNLHKQLIINGIKFSSLLLIIVLLVCFGILKYNEYKSNKDINDILDLLPNDVLTEDEDPLTGLPNPSEEENEQTNKTAVALTEDYDRLTKINIDTVGWLKVNNTRINYPIVKYTDNEFYLNHTFNKSKNLNGWAYLDYRNNLDDINALDNNYIIYGHQGRIFGTLNNCLQQYWYTNPDNNYITFNSKNKQMTWQIFAIYTTEPEFDYRVVRYQELNNMTLMLNTALEKSIYNFGVTVSNNDHILTLSTCTKDGTKRIVVQAKLI